MSFQDLGLSKALLRAVQEHGYASPTPVQAQAIPPALAGRDLLACARTGTGKTAAFVLPILQRLAAGPEHGRRRPVRCLILTPTRELASQVGASIRTYGAHLPLRHAVVFGGVGQGRQVAALRRGVDLLVACPGRLLDLMNQGLVDLSGLTTFVLDEADRMLDMGFIRDVRRVIAALPDVRQTLLFSATVPDEIDRLADELLAEPVRVRVAPTAAPTAETVTQSVYRVAQKQKFALLMHLLEDASMERILVFTRTKHGADRVARQLTRERITADAIHGNKSQNARQRALASFKAGRCRVLVASDIASRGIDIDDVSHVVNFELPHEPETYVHRIGRTGRAGRSGIAFSFCAADERPRLRGIQKLISRVIPEIADHPYAEDEQLASDRAPARPHGAGPRSVGPTPGRERARGRGRSRRRDRR